MSHRTDEFLLKWLKEEIKLEPIVKNIINEFSNGYRFSEILFNINEITKEQFNEFSNSLSLDIIKNNFILIKKYLKELFELEIRKEEFNDIINKHISKATIILYKLKNSISKKKINFLNIKISLNNLTQEQIHQKVEEIINYEYYNDIFNKDLLYDIQYEENNSINNYENKYSSTIKLYKSDFYQNNFSLQRGFSNDKIDIKPELKLKVKLLNYNINNNEKKNENNKIFSKKLLFNRDQNNKINLNSIESKKDISKIKLPSINNLNNLNNLYKSKEYLNENQKIYMNTENKTTLTTQKSSIFITNHYRNNLNNLYNQKSKFGNGKINITQENKFKISKLTESLLKYGVRDFRSSFKNNLQEFNPSNEKELEKVRVELKNKISLKKSESTKKPESIKKQIKIRLYDIPEIDFLHKERNSLYKSQLPIGISLLKHNKYLTFPKRLKYANNWKIYSNQKKMEKKIKYYSSLVKKSYKKNEDNIKKQFFDKQIFFSNLSEYQNFNKILNNKRLKLNKDLPLIRNIILLIIDMTMEIYFYKEEKDIELIDIETYIKFLELFINNKPMRERVTDREARIIKEKNNENDDINPDKLILNDDEINLKEDYKNYIGLFNDEKIMNKEYRGMKIDIKKINPFLSTDYEPTENDIEDLTFPYYNTQNYSYGDIILELLDNKYTNNNKKIISSNVGKWDYINYKIALIGLPFCGKKFIAEEINKTYPNLKVYSLQKILRNYYEQYKTLYEPIENNPKFKSLKKNQIEQLNHEKENKIKEFEPILKIIQSYIDSINQNKNESNEKDEDKNIIFPSDEVLLKILIYNIEKDFIKLSEEEINNEIINTQKSISNLINQKEKIKNQIKQNKDNKDNKDNKKTSLKDEQLLLNIEKEIETIKNNYIKGFILVDFPTNINQCNLLEYYLNGYIDEIKNPKSEKTINIQNINSLIDFNFYPKDNNKIKKSWIDFIINIISNEEDINERFNKTKYDPLNDKIYSEYELNQEKNNKDKKLMERLVNNIPYYTEKHFDYYKKEYNENIYKINLFYNMFGFSKNSNNDIDSNINSLSIFNNEQDMDIKKTYQEINIEDIDLISNLSNDENKNKNILIKKEDEIKNKIMSFINDDIIKFLFEKKDENDKKIFFGKCQELNEEEEKNKIKFEPDYKINEIRQNLSSKKINKEKLFKYLNDNFDSILSDLKLFNIKYEKHVGKFIYLMKKQKLNIYKRLNLIQKKYRDFLNQESDKKEVIDEFCNKYNSFFTLLPEAFNSEMAIKEFSFNINELNNVLWFLINIKETVSIKELQEIKSSNFIEFELKKFFKNIKEIFLIETEKFLTMINSIINLYKKNYNDESTIAIIKMIKNNKENDKIKKNKNNNSYTKEYILRNLIEISNENLYDEGEDEDEDEEENENYNIKNSNNIKNNNIFYNNKKNHTKSIDYLINKNIEIIFNNCLNLILAQEEKIESLLKSVKEYMNIGNKKIKIKKKCTQYIPVSTTSGIFQKENESIIEENIKKMLQNEKNKYKYRICFLKSFVFKYIIIIIQTSIKMFQNIDNWITKSINLQSEAQNKVIQKLKIILNERRLIDFKKDIYPIELDSFEPVTNNINNNSHNNSDEVAISPRDNNLRVYDKLSIDFLINDDFINIKIKEDIKNNINNDELNYSDFDIKKYKIILPDEKKNKNDKSNLIIKEVNNLNTLKYNYLKTDFHYNIEKFLELYNKIKLFEIKKDTISEEIFYEVFIKKYLFNKEIFDKNIDSKNINKNDNNKINLNNNKIDDLPFICKPLRNLNSKDIKKLLTLFKINIDHKIEDKFNIEIYENNSDNTQNNLNNDEHFEKETHEIIYENYLNNSEIFTILSLIGCQILSEKKEKEMMIELNNKIINDNFLTKSDFYKYNFWFETDFDYLNNNNNNNSNNNNNNFYKKFKRNSIIKTKTIIKKFERKNTMKNPSLNSEKVEKIKKNNEIKNITIKDLLFKIWKSDNGDYINFKDFINTLNISKYISHLEDYNEKKYFDIIFNNEY